MKSLLELKVRVDRVTEKEYILTESMNKEGILYAFEIMISDLERLMSKGSGKDIIVIKEIDRFPWTYRLEVGSGNIELFKHLEGVKQRILSKASGEKSSISYKFENIDEDIEKCKIVVYKGNTGKILRSFFVTKDIAAKVANDLDAISLSEHYGKHKLITSVSDKKPVSVNTKDYLFDTEINKMHSSAYDDKGTAAHYNKSRIEVMIMIERTYGTVAAMHFCEINAFKYRMRLGHKDSMDNESKKISYYDKAAEIFRKKLGSSEEIHINDKEQRFKID